MNQLNAKFTDLSALELETQPRCEKIIKDSSLFNVPPVVKPENIYNVKKEKKISFNSE